MAGPSNPSSYGFFGQGAWGRKVSWDKVPVQHRELDTEGHLEGLLRAWGDELESFLTQIGNLPLQREPYAVRAKEGEEEWFYFTEAFSYDDSYWGTVVRLVGEKVYANMPNHDEDDTPTSDATELEEWWGWWPYAPISSVARWWKGTWDDVTYEVVRVRTRSFDWPATPYNATSSQANEVWLQGGDLQIFFDYLSDGFVWRDDWTEIGTGDGTDATEVAFPYLPVRLEYNDTASPPPWATGDSKLRLRLDLISGGEYFDIYDVPNGTVTETGNLYPQTVDASNSGATISFVILGNLITVTDTSAPFTSGMEGNTIRITGTVSNDGVFEIASYVDTQNVTYVNANGATESGAVGNAWEVGTGEIGAPATWQVSTAYNLRDSVYSTAGDQYVCTTAGNSGLSEPTWDTTVGNTTNDNTVVWTRVVTASYGTINYQIGKLDLDLSAILGAGDQTTIGSSIYGKWYVKGYYLPFYPPTVIGRLARDFGFENDENDPEDVQRSTIANITKYHGLKASQDSYRIRGEISLFTVVARAWWYMCDEGVWDNLPLINRFKHHGYLYTDLDPREIRFDDISADQQFYDPDDNSWKTLLDNSLMYEDSSTDGYSIGLAYGLDVAQGYYGRVAHYSEAARVPAGVISSTLLTDVEADTYGFQAGYRVVVRTARCQEYAFNWSKGPFGITEYNKSGSDVPALSDHVFWIDNSEVVWTKKTPSWEATDWIASTAYSSGDYIYSSVGDAYECTTGGASGGTEPTWNTTVGVTTNDNTVVWTRRAYAKKVEVLLWQNANSYSLNDRVYSTEGDMYECTTAGTSGGTEPAWDTTVGNTTNDNTVVWTRVVTILGIDEDVGEWTVIIGVGVDSSGNPNDGPNVGHADITAVDQGNRLFTVLGDYTSTMIPGNMLGVYRSSGNNGNYTIQSATLSGSSTEVEVVEAIPSATADGELGWLDAAIRYYPEVNFNNCCFCKSYKMRVEIEPTDEAYEYYDTDSSMNAAIDRMRNKILSPDSEPNTLKPSLIPIHARVVDWAITKSWTLENIISATPVDLELTEFLADPISDISAVNQSSRIFTINGDKVPLLAKGDTVDIRGSTGNDGAYLIDDGGYVGVQLSSSQEDTYVEVIYPLWEASTAYLVGDRIYSSDDDPYECTTAGTSGVSEPTWNTAIGATTNDNTAVWTRIAQTIPSTVADGSLYLRPSKILMTVEQRGTMGSGQTMTMKVYNEDSVEIWSVTQGSGVDDTTNWSTVVSDLDVTNDIGNNSPVKIEAKVASGTITDGDVKFTFTVSKYLR